MAPSRSGNGRPPLRKTLKTPRKKPAAKRDAAAGDGRPEAAPTATRKPIGERFARTTAPRELDDPKRRKEWGLPGLDEPDATGPYIVELNVEHLGGLAGADHAFRQLHGRHVPQGPKPVSIAKSYYRCLLTDRQWRAMVREDEDKDRSSRAIYRLWPDFPVEAQTHRSITTIKADAALRSFDAGGEKIVWAVVDSGIEASHRHFGEPSTKEGEIQPEHLLLAPEVIHLHRHFGNAGSDADGVAATAVLDDPDERPDMADDERNRRLAAHRRWALRDDFGHGTHVAGIIAGKAPEPKDGEVCALERQFKTSEDGRRKEANSFARRTFGSSLPRPRGVAPRCKLVSLRVLDDRGKGRASQVIQALEYIRQRINDNPKILRVQGVNLSVGYDFDAEMFACGQSPLCTAVDRLVQEGVVVVTAAGNTGYGTAAAAVGSTKMYFSNSINDPGNAASAITVGSTHRDAPHTYGVSYFSSKGPTGDGRMKPDLVAPGERITSCAAGRKRLDAIKSAGLADASDDTTVYYVDDSGTSMAAPHVSGAIAAFLSIRREFIGKPLEVKRIFLESATPLGRERYFEGHGLIDLMRAIQMV